MSIIKRTYHKLFLIRFDPDPAIPYYKASDFKGLKEEEHTFTNSLGVEIHYFIYQKEVTKNKTLLFLPGMGPGHIAYFREIDELTSLGYKVITLDYTGCGYSKGDHLPSMNTPTRDVIDLLNKLDNKEEIVIVGHSLGAYTALNVINLKSDIHKAIIISGIMNAKGALYSFTHSHIVANLLARYERKLDKEYGNINNKKYLETTTDDLLIIQSNDDPTISYKYNFLRMVKIKNNHLNFVTVHDKKHNPSYTVESVNYKNKIIDTYMDRLNKNEFKSIEERKEYFKDVSIDKLTTQDKDFYKLITDYIEK